MNASFAATASTDSIATDSRLPDDWTVGHDAGKEATPTRKGPTLLGVPLELMTWHGRSLAALRRRGFGLAFCHPAVAPAAFAAA